MMSLSVSLFFLVVSGGSLGTHADGDVMNNGRKSRSKINGGNPGIDEYKKTRTLPPLGVSDPVYWQLFHRAHHRDLSIYLRESLHLRLFLEAFLELGCDEQVLDQVIPRIQCKSCIAAHRAAMSESLGHSA